MAGELEQWVLSVMAGTTRGVRAAAARSALAALEPAYIAAAVARNRAFDRGHRATHRLARPVVSVGNLTTGGTGKTPAVQWLVRALEARGHRPAVLLRGYRKAGAPTSDEEQLLRDSLHAPVVADADRVRGGAAIVATHPDVTVIILDDGFQHRRLARDVDLVLIDATQPFGFDHVLPRGLLREPVREISRANLVMLTRTDQVDAAAIAVILKRVRAHTPVPIVQSTHRLTEMIETDGRASELAAWRGRRVMVVSAIGNPAAFERSLTAVGIDIAVTRRFRDHHAYNDNDVASILEAARGAGADWCVTTEKDWMKLSSLAAVRKSSPSFARGGLQLTLTAADEAVALETIERGIGAGALRSAAEI